MNIYCNTNLVENEVDVWKFQSMTMAENDPRVIGFESRQQDISQFLKIKVEAPGNCKVDSYVDLVWRINTALESLNIKYSGSQNKTIIVFVDNRLESVLRHVAGLSLLPYELHFPLLEDTPLP
ncbi:hypothetical protein T4D_16797 [Trichinella pseudospiralis]|uniref:Uncharacterized protein n=1 Tax=Trichinella pseudospiralis TaxID=6337 RepID=A0A0V1FAM5_TRIPS|nr:hypothetical protein T4D_16797 [Trichinella pseudospiralis]